MLPPRMMAPSCWLHCHIAMAFWGWGASLRLWQRRGSGVSAGVSGVNEEGLRGPTQSPVSLQGLEFSGQGLALAYFGPQLVQRMGQVWGIWCLRGIEGMSALGTSWRSSLDLEATLKPGWLPRRSSPSEDRGTGGLLSRSTLSLPLSLSLQGLEVTALHPFITLEALLVSGVGHRHISPSRKVVL